MVSHGRAAINTNLVLLSAPVPLVGLRPAEATDVIWLTSPNLGGGRADCTKVRASHAPPLGFHILRHRELLGVVQVPELVSDARGVVHPLTGRTQ